MLWPGPELRSVLNTLQKRLRGHGEWPRGPGRLLPLSHQRWWTGAAEWGCSQKGVRVSELQCGAGMAGPGLRAGCSGFPSPSPSLVTTLQSLGDQSLSGLAVWGHSAGGQSQGQCPQVRS